MPTTLAESNTNVNTLPSHDMLHAVLTMPATPVSHGNFNPGNLMFAGQPGAVQGPAKPKGGYWASFPDEATGYKALQADTQAKVNRNQNLTVAQLLDMRSPPSENNTSALHYNVMDELKDLKDSGKISTLMANKLLVRNVPADRLAQAIAKAEGYKSSPQKTVASK